MLKALQADGRLPGANVAWIAMIERAMADAGLGPQGDPAAPRP